MEAKPDKTVVFEVRFEELSIEIQKTVFIPKWFQLELGKFLNNIIKAQITSMNLGNKVVNKNQENKSSQEHEALVDEYVNWEKTSNNNYFKIYGSIKYENKTKSVIQIFISKGDSIKFSRNYTNDIDNIIEELPQILAQIKDFILLSSQQEKDIKILIDFEECYRQLIKLLETKEEDSSPEKYFVNGLFLAKAGYEEKAIKNLDYAVSNSTKPEMVQDCYKVILAVKAKKNMKDLESAQNEVYNGDPNKAISLIQSLIQITPEYIHLHFLLGTAYKRSGQIDKSIEAYKKALEIDSNHIPSLRELAEELGSVGNLTEVESMYKKIIELNQANAIDYYNLGMCLKRMGRIKELDGIIEKIKELDTEGKLDSYIFNLFDMSSGYFNEEKEGNTKKTFFNKLFGKR